MAVVVVVIMVIVIVIVVAVRTMDMGLLSHRCRSGIKSLHDLAQKYNVSAERIRQLEKSAMNKLKLSIAA
ncbi:sigma factor-like helix-turn-helix DNA-binding protein, partial [Klebsiella pneumoniae]|uniref:sigma factor-like helix-turn-helix DNA-binding protein n=1 Tax=Klebsiella pneumoniae TaxID=573 RepID=UPI003F90C275